MANALFTSLSGPVEASQLPRSVAALLSASTTHPHLGPLDLPLIAVPLPAAPLSLEEMEDARERHPGVDAVGPARLAGLLLAQRLLLVGLLVKLVLLLEVLLGWRAGHAA